MADRRTTLVPGIGLIILGLVFLLPNFTDLNMRELWPFLVIGPGILFFAIFLADRSSYGLLMPAAILTVSGGVFLYCTVYGWHTMRTLWPFYMIAPGLGFLLMYQWGKKEKGLLVPGYILVGLGAMFLLAFSDLSTYWPVVLIIMGLVLVFRSRPARND